ncbi:chaperone protein dnaJ 6 [Zea mays]|uniref:Chaperone protein dnaJ 6 n=1 Tax=Zea mays TaxID=4577 RepID=A0A1D6EPZ5_MAIZE|nr:chaperone protein dnaJ 6 [Zea mays]ONM21840.1 Chaperone protein dnaJ 6 [Zea mays]|eukprot:XP_020404677.1 chaperone protein dnaJ 6 [Zea mays]
MDRVGLQAFCKRHGLSARGSNADLIAHLDTALGIIGVEKTASQQEIKKVYHKLALRLHPDKNPGDEETKEKFQLLQKVISILGDAEKRALYDETGITDDDALVGEAANNLQEYFRTMYKKVWLLLY